MAKLTYQAFQAKYNRLFADNEIQNITEATFREWSQDMTDSFAGQDKGPNATVGGTKYVAYLTQVEAIAAGRGPNEQGPGVMTLDQVDPLTVVLDNLACVNISPLAPHPTWLTAAYDDGHGPYPVAPGFKGCYDGSGTRNFKLAGDSVGLASLKWVLKDSAEALSANVPDWDVNYNQYGTPPGYRIGDLVKQQFPAVTVTFRALQAGRLAAPTSKDGDANWYPIVNPVAEFALSQHLLWDQLRDLAADDQLMAGRQYHVFNRQDQSGAPLYDLRINALNANELEPEGWEEHTGSAVRVNYDLSTDTTTPLTVTVDSYTKAEDDALLAALVAQLRDGVAAEGDTLQKLYNLLQLRAIQYNVPNLAARNALSVRLGAWVNVDDDGDGRWAIYRATSSGLNATYNKVSDPDLLNAAMTAPQIKAAYESNADTNAFTNSQLAKLNGIAPAATANSSDVQLRDRSTHTGSQALTTVTGLVPALAGLAPLNSPTFTGTPSAPNTSQDTNNQQIANTKYVRDALSAPGLLQAQASAFYSVFSADFSTTIKAFYGPTGLQDALNAADIDVAANRPITSIFITGLDPLNTVSTAPNAFLVLEGLTNGRVNINVENDASAPLKLNGARNLSFQSYGGNLRLGGQFYTNCYIASAFVSVNPNNSVVQPFFDSCDVVELIDRTTSQNILTLKNATTVSYPSQLATFSVTDLRPLARPGVLPTSGSSLRLTFATNAYYAQVTTAGNFSITTTLTSAVIGVTVRVAFSSATTAVTLAATITVRGAGRFVAGVENVYYLTFVGVGKADCFIYQ